MTKPDERESFRIIDIVMMVAATALALAAIRTDSQVQDWMIPFPGTVAFYGPPPLGNLLRNGSFLSGAAAALLMAWSTVLLWCAWRRGRRRVGLIVERPGLLACAVAVLVMPWVFFLPMTIEIAMPKGGRVRVHELPPGLFADHILGFLKRKVGACVIMAWVALVACRKWRKPIGMVEWSGLAIGLGWIATWLAYLALG
jgi:hypothetical protein